MARLTGQLLEKYGYILSLWKFSGYINWKAPAREFVEKNLEGYSTKGIAELMHLHARAGGKIDQVAETREVWRDLHQYHYDFRLEIDGRRIYVETVFHEEADKDDCEIHVVSTHYA